MFLPHVRGLVGWQRPACWAKHRKSWARGSSMWASTGQGLPLLDLDALYEFGREVWGRTILMLRAEHQGVVNVGPALINKIDYQAFGDHLHFQAKWKHIYFGCWVSGGWGNLWAYGRLTLLLEKMISIKFNICFRLASVLSMNLCTNLRAPVKFPYLCI